MDKIDIDKVDGNPYMTNLYNFNFGIPNDHPEIYQIFPQDLRIDMCSDSINEQLNIEYLTQLGLIDCCDGLHNWYDRNILMQSIARFDQIFSKISRRELLIIKH